MKPSGTLCVMFFRAVLFFILTICNYSSFGANFDSSEVFSIIGRIDGRMGSPEGHGTLTMHQGALVIVFSKDSGQGNGGFAFYDIKDPRHPKLINRVQNDVTETIREAHGYGYARVNGRDYVALQATDGIQIWDWSSLQDPKLVKHLVLPGIERSDYAMGAWWLSWQHPHLYLGGSGNGLYIVDTTNLSDAKLVKRTLGSNPIPPTELGGFRIGPVFAIGNLLVATSMDDAGFATIDISNPIEPSLIRAWTKSEGAPDIYSSLVNGNKILGVGKDGDFFVYDISQPYQFRFINSAPLPSKGGYATFQDGFAHVGASKAYVKIDMRDERHFNIVGKATSNIKERDEDFGNVIGNLVFISDDHGNGSSITPHQAAEDKNPPMVNMVNPLPGSTDNPTTTRIGLTFTDQINVQSLLARNFIVRSASGKIIDGFLSTQSNTVNFSPTENLEPGETYEIVLPAGGIKDYAGNGLAETFTAKFSISTNDQDTGCSLQMPPSGQINDSISFQGFGGENFQWDFGNGTTTTPWNSDSKTFQNFSKPGHYMVTLSVRNGQNIRRCSKILTIHEDLIPSSSSTPITWDSAGNLWVVNPDSNSVSFIDPLQKKMIREMPVGKHPRTIAEGPNREIWVTNEESDSISVIQTDQTSGIALPYGSRPFGILFNSNKTYAWVSLGAIGTVLKIDTNKRQIIGETKLPGIIRGLSLTPDETQLLVARFISPDTQGEVFRIDPFQMKLLGKIPLAYDITPDGEDRGRGVPNYLGHMAISPNGHDLWIPSKKDNISRGIRRDGQPLTFENSVRTIVMKVDLSSGKEDLKARKDLNDRDMAQAIAFSPLGDYIFIAVQGTGSIDVLDAFSGELITSLENVGFAPQGLILDNEGKKLFIHNFLSRNITVFDVSEITSNRSRRFRFLEAISTTKHDLLPPNILRGKQIFYNAKDRRMSRDGYISCASCHLDGGQDGRVWDFSDRGEGLRNTITLLGHGGTRQGPLHWTANFDEIQDFEHDIRNGFGGLGFLTDQEFNQGSRNTTLGDKKSGLNRDLDSLAAYVSSLINTPKSPYRIDGKLTTKGLEGKKVFQDLQCIRCHSGGNFTDSNSQTLHDVGTIKTTSGSRLGQNLLGFDTPTLKGLALTMPYGHDGSAKNLDEFFSKITKNENSSPHGVVSDLPSDKRVALLAYLLEIDDQESDIGVNSHIVSGVKAKSKRNYQIGILTDGAQVAIDSPKNTIELVPTGFLGKEFILTAQKDRKEKDDDFLIFNLSNPAIVYVVYDGESSRIPKWLSNGWTKQDGKTIRVDGKSRKIFFKKFEKGKVSLGANSAKPAKDVDNNYFVIIAPTP